MALERASMPVGIVVRRTPGVTRWAKWAWKVVAVLPGAPPANWRELRRDGEAVEYHAATLTLDLWSTDTEAAASTRRGPIICSGCTSSTVSGAEGMGPSRSCAGPNTNGSC